MTPWVVGSLKGSSVYGISQARILEWVAIFFSRYLPNPGIQPVSPALAGRFFTTELLGKPIINMSISIYKTKSFLDDLSKLSMVINLLKSFHKWHKSQVKLKIHQSFQAVKWMLNPIEIAALSYLHMLCHTLGFPRSSFCKETACSVGDRGLFLGWEDPLEKEMATHSSVLTWRIPWTEKPCGLQSMELQESDTTYLLNHHHAIPWSLLKSRSIFENKQIFISSAKSWLHSYSHFLHILSFYLWINHGLKY